MVVPASRTKFRGRSVAKMLLLTGFLLTSLPVYYNLFSLKQSLNEESVLAWIRRQDDVPLMAEKSKDTVMAFAAGPYSLKDYQRFINPLRKSGFDGNIILALKTDADPDILDYLKEQNVTSHFVEKTNCTYNYDPAIHKVNRVREWKLCFHPYPELRVRMSRYPLFRDFLLECDDCRFGQVLFVDFRDVFFQGNPFQGNHVATGLELFEEPPSLRSTSWFVSMPIEKCKGETLDDGPMLCSGTTLGTRDAMLEYLNIMYEEMKLWMMNPNCSCIFTGGDQGIHNYLYYKGKFPFATTVPNRQGPVITLGGIAYKINAAHRKRVQTAFNLTKKEANAAAQNHPFVGSDGEFKWIGLRHGLTDKDGYFLQLDGSRSPVVHQYDRFMSLNNSYEDWIERRRGELW